MESGGLIALGVDCRVSGAKSFERRRAFVREQVLDTPGVFRFQDADVMTARDEFRGDASQKVRVAVIPVRQDGMAEDYDAHSVSDLTRW